MYIRFIDYLIYINVYYVRTIRLIYIFFKYLNSLNIFPLKLKNLFKKYKVQLYTTQYNTVYSLLLFFIKLLIFLKIDVETRCIIN